MRNDRTDRAPRLDDDRSNGRRRRRFAWGALAWLSLGALAGIAVLSGCGEKIVLPEPRGLFGVNDYLIDTVFVEIEPVQVAVINNNLFILSAAGELTKRDLEFGEIAQVSNLAGPTSLCADDEGTIVFVWEQDAKRVQVYASSDLSFRNATELPHVQRTVAMAACRAGIDSVAGARTFLYLSDPDSGVVHRYSYDDFNGLSPHGILARSDGDAARFVHVPAGMAKDAADSLLVCDADSSRNWVIRFNPLPDYTDVTANPDDHDPWRGRAALFTAATCEPPAASDYTLGDAAECQESGWTGGPSSAEGEFDRPRAVAVDGRGYIYVADTGNDRIQIFTGDGYYEMLYGSVETVPGPTSLGVVDWRYGSGADDVNYGAYLFVLIPGSSEVRKLISFEEYIRVNQDLPPEPN